MKRLDSGLKIIGLWTAIVFFVNSAIAENSSYFPVFMRTAQGANWPDDQSPEFFNRLKTAGFNTMTDGFFYNPADTQITNFQQFRDHFDTAVIPRLRQYSADGFHVLGSGDDLARFPHQLRWTLETPWAPQAVTHVVQQLTAVPRILACDWMDEVGSIWGPTPTPSSPNPWAHLNIPIDAFTRLFGPTLLRSPALSNHLLYGWNTNYVDWIRSPFADWNTIEWDYVTQGDDRSSIVDYYNIAKNTRDQFRQAHPNIPLAVYTSGTGPFYRKWARGNQCVPGQDQIIALGDIPEGASAQVLMAVALGFTGIRVYHYDWGKWRQDRQAMILSGFYAPSAGGLYRAKLDGSWEIMNPAANVNSLIAWDTQLFYGTDNGVFFSRGENTTNLESYGSPGSPVTVVGFDLTRSNLLYAGTPNGLFSKAIPSDPWVRVPGVPSIPIRCLTSLYSPYQRDRIYIGTSEGLYVREGDNPARRVAGIPVVQINDLKEFNGHLLYIGTQSTDLYVLGLDGQIIPANEIRTYPGLGPVYGFFQREADQEIYGGTERGFYLLRPYEDVNLPINQGLPPGRVTKVTGGGLDRAYALASDNSLYTLNFGDQNPQWRRDAAAPSQIRNIQLIVGGDLQTGFSPDGAGRDLWNAYAAVLPIVAELEPKIIAPPVRRETIVREAVVATVHEGNGWKVLFAVNGSANPVSLNLQTLLGSAPTNPRLRTVLGTQISNLPYNATITLPALTAAILESRPTSPQILQQPENQTVTEPQSATFQVRAEAVPPPSYQWKRNGVPIGGATSNSYTTPPTALSDNGARFSCTVSNSEGSVTSQEAILTVTPRHRAPGITRQPDDVTVQEGESASFSVLAEAHPAPRYQWKKNGIALSEGTSPVYTIRRAAVSDGGRYQCEVSNAAGSASTREALLTVHPSLGPGASSPDITVSPNPIDASKGQQAMVFYNVPAGSALSIYARSGKLIRQLTAGGNTVEWDLKSHEKEDVASGTYSVIIRIPGRGEKKLKVSVIR